MFATWEEMEIALKKHLATIPPEQHEMVRKEWNKQQRLHLVSKQSSLPVEDLLLLEKSVNPSGPLDSTSFETIGQKYSLEGDFAALSVIRIKSK